MDQERYLRLETLILKGKMLDTVPNSEPWEEAIEFLAATARQDPESLLVVLHRALHSRVINMVLPGLAILICNASTEFWKAKYIEILGMLSENYASPKLLELVEYLKSKAFGKGFGSRPQKMLREVMESWHPSYLEALCRSYPTSTIDLIKLVHPRYQGIRAEIVRNIL